MFKIIIIFFLVNISLFSQSTAGDNAIYESIYIADFPTAGMQPKNHLNYDIELFDNGGLLLSADYALFNRLSLGVSYGGTGIIGQGRIQYQNLPGFKVKFRPFNETIHTPAIAIGFDSQGKGAFSISANRFDYLPPHLYLALSKNFVWSLGNLAIHAGLNYNFELRQENRNINYYFGLEQSVSSNHALIAEFIGDNHTNPISENRGYLNVAYRYSLHKGVTLELKLRDILKNQIYSNNFSRILRIEIITMN